MQLLSAPPRDGLTAAAVTNLLTADNITVASGCELLDASDVFVRDLSDDLVDGTIRRECEANVHGTCELQLSTTLAWGRDRVRPYMTITAPTASGMVSARFNLGVYLLTSPSRKLSTDAVTTVSGYDKLHLLQALVGDSYTVAAGALYLDAVRVAIRAAGAGDLVLLDATAAQKTLPAAMSWPLSAQTQSTWLNIVNDLLAAIGYRGVWVDQDGFFRSEPYRPPQERPLEWRFNVDDARTTIVGEERTVTEDVWGVPNFWRFLRRDLEDSPTEGDGQYTVTNDNDGPTSLAALGRRVPRVEFLDAADQASLQTQGDAIVATDRRVSTVLAINTGPLPIAGHFDVCAYSDGLAPTYARLQATRWTLPLSGADMDWTFTVVPAVAP